jgi:PBP4 family serine-type D-alanyl-D-alanine carboxypeptidase
VLPHFMKPSQNQIGEALLRTTGGVVTGVASADSGRAVAAATLTGFGIDPAAFVLSDGSGLSRYNYVAPEALARILEVMARRPDADVFLNSLPIGGVDGTLATRMRGTAAEGNVRAKTGSIANTRTLSGYVATRDGERLVFVLMANHFTVSSRVAERVQDHVVERLANFSRQNR